MVEQVLMQIFNQTYVTFPHIKEGGIEDLIVGAWKGMARSPAALDQGYDIEIHWMDNAKECFKDDYGVIYDTWRATYESMADSNDGDRLYDVGLYMGAALYLNRLAVDNECLDANPDAEFNVNQIGELIGEALENPDVVALGIKAMQDESEGSPTYHLREALKNFRLGDTEEAGRQYGLFLTGVLTGIY